VNVHLDQFDGDLRQFDGDSSSVWIAEVQSSSVNGADGASSSVHVQARQSGSLGGDHPNSVRVTPPPASLLRHCRPTS
jgi:hypothetical protein